MSALKRMFVRRSVCTDTTPRPAAAVPVLLASSRDDDVERVPALLPREQWMLIKVSSWTHVLQLVGTVIIPVVLCDREIPGLEWPRGLAQLRQCFRPPTLVLLSDLAAESLSQEMIRYGAFDMLFRPLCHKRLLTALDLARIHWEMRLERTATANVPLSL